jgi:hypothetical protein
MPASPEMRLLAHCLPHVESTHNLTLDTASVAWPVFLDLAQWHGIMPLAAHRLLDAPSSSAAIDLPHPVIADLRASRERQLLRSLTAVSALIELQREFDAHGIKVLSWKGPSAGLLLFGSALLRESADLDFIFLESDLPVIQAITARLGYSGQTLADAKDRYEFANQHEFSFFRSRDHIVLEFHSQIMTTRFSAWQQSHAYVDRANVTYPIAGTQLLLPCPEDLLVSLCVHAVKHNWDRLKWSCDVAMFLQHYGDTLDWTAYLDELAHTGKHSVVLLGLSIASVVFELQLPPAVVAMLGRTPGISALGAYLAHHLTSGSTGPIPRERVSQLVTLLCPRLYDRLVYVLSPIIRLEYEDLYFGEQNRALFFLNYPYRFWRLLRRHGLPRLLSMTVLYIRSVR